MKINIKKVEIGKNPFGNSAPEHRKGGQKTEIRNKHFHSYLIAENIT
jgi:hypothetical protein